jgi:hypothetical protein
VHPGFRYSSSATGKQRNARVFSDVRRQLSTEQLVEAIEEEFKLWELARNGGSTTDARE